MRLFHIRLAAVCVGLMGLLAAGSNTVLADGNGADQNGGLLTDTECFDLGGGYRMCAVLKGEYLYTVTPSGRYIYQENLTFTDTLYLYGEVVDQDHQKEHDQ